jgi:high-affinity iron transporter
MFGSAIIVFRETLEAALIIGIIAAATHQIPGRNRWLAAGLLAGLVGAGAVAATTGMIADMASGMGQELLNAGILGIAVIMLAWHNIWMTVHGRELAQNAKATGHAIRDGRQECSVIFAIIALAVLREGSETALFLYGIAATEQQGAHATLTGGALGLIAGIVTGWALYAGLLKMPLKWFFNATSTLVLLLAAGLASQAAKFLIQADLIPSLRAPLWDTSALLPQDSAAGILLHGFTGYDARPAGMQILFYVTVMAVILIGMRLTRNLNSKR